MVCIFTKMEINIKVIGKTMLSLVLENSHWQIRNIMKGISKRVANTVKESTFGMQQKKLTLETSVMTKDKG